MPVLKDCLAHRDHGVRLEAATVMAAVAQAFPIEGRKFVIESLSSFLPNMDAIQSLSLRVASETTSTPKGRFRRGVQDNDTAGSRLADELVQHQCHMHGNALAVSMLMHEFPHVVGGIARVIVDKTFDVCEKLLQCQSNEAFVNVSVSRFGCPCFLPNFQSLISPLLSVHRSGKSKCRMHLHPSWVLHPLGLVHNGSRCCRSSCYFHLQSLAK